MKKLLRKKDIFLLMLAEIGDVIEEIRDPLRLVSSSYESMYGFIPKEYRHHNFSLLVGKSFKTGYIDRIIKNTRIIKNYKEWKSVFATYVCREGAYTKRISHIVTWEDVE